MSQKESFFPFFFFSSPEAYYGKTGDTNEQEFLPEIFFFLSNWIMKEFLQSERDYLWSRFSVGECRCSEDIFRYISILKNSDEKNT